MTKRVKILLLIPDLDRGGPTLGAAALGCYLDQRRYEVVVGSFGTEQSAAKSMIRMLKKSGVSIHYFNMPGWVSLLRLGRVRKYVCRNQVSIVHSFGLRPDIVNYFLRHVTRTVASVRGMIREEYRLRSGVVVEKLFTLLHVAVLKRMHAVTALSRAMLEYLTHEGVPRGKLVYIPNVVDLNWCGQESDQLQRGIEFAPGVVHLGVVGSFIPRKRVDFAIKAFGELRLQSKASAHLHLIGDGPLAPKLKKLVGELGLQEMVYFHGFTEKIASLMRALDIIVLTSESEGMPRVVLEGMSLGKTCVVSDIAGMDELVVDGVTGYLFDKTSYQDLARVLGRIIQERAFLNPDAVRAHVVDHFNARHGAVTTAALYESMLGI